MTAEGYAAVPNWLIRDSDLSLYGVAVYAALASHSGPGGIHPGQETLAREARCSVRKVGAALNELEALGVVERVRRKNAAGRAPTGYRLHPHGRLAADEVSAPGADTGSVVPASGAGGSGTSVQPILIEEKPVEEQPSAFDRFWALWPRSDAKKAAVKAWASAIKREHPEVIIAGAEAWLARQGGRSDPGWMPYASTWLNGDRWTEGVLPAPAALRAREEVW